MQRSDLTESQTQKVTGEIVIPEKDNWKPALTVSKGQFSFDLIDCYKEDRTTTFDLNIINVSEDDVDLYLFLHDTKFFDQSGNEYVVTVAKIANSASKNGWYRINKQIVASTTVPVSLIFDDVSSITSTVSLLNLRFANDLGDIQFRNIPIKIK